MLTSMIAAFLALASLQVLFLVKVADWIEARSAMSDRDIGITAAHGLANAA